MTDNEAVEDDGKKEQDSLLHFVIPIVPYAPCFFLSKALHWLKNRALCLSFSASEIIRTMKQNRTGKREYNYKTGRQKFLLPINH